MPRDPRRLLALRWTRPALVAFLLSCSDGPTSPSATDFPDEPAPDPAPGVVAFTDVHVVSMEADRVERNRTVLVRDGRIEAVGAVGEVSTEGAFVIDGRGRYLMPGLADMHTHMTSRTFTDLRNDYVLFLANGVTTIRVMWGSRGLVADRGRIEAGEVLGPALMVASPGLDAPGGTWTASTAPVATPAEARARVAEHVDTGYDFIKVYNDLTNDVYDAIVDEARARGIPIVGHVPWRVGLPGVQDSGQLTMEHFIGLKQRTVDGRSLDEAEARSLAARSRDLGLWHTPTTTVIALSAQRVGAIRASRELGLVSPGMRQFFEEGFFHGSPIADQQRESHAGITRALRDVDGNLLVGTDAGFGWVLPGYSIREELAHFREAGLTPFEALRGATTEAARSVGQDGEFGRVAPGLRGDLVLLTRNPLTDLQALEEISGVMVRGRWLSRGTLEEMLDDIEASNASGTAASSSDRIGTPALPPAEAHTHP